MHAFCCQAHKTAWTGLPGVIPMLSTLNRKVSNTTFFKPVTAKLSRGDLVNSGSFETPNQALPLPTYQTHVQVHFTLLGKSTWKPLCQHKLQKDLDLPFSIVSTTPQRHLFFHYCSTYLLTVGSTLQTNTNQIGVDSSLTSPVSASSQTWSSMALPHCLGIFPVRKR